MDILKYFGYQKIKEPNSNIAPESSFSYSPVYGHNNIVVSKVWDGEKTLGELGAVVQNVPDYAKLRIRSYHAYETMDLVKTIISKHFYWTIGTGLKLACEPNRKALKAMGIPEIDFVEFQQNVESRFAIHAKSKECDFLKQKSLHELAMDFFQASYLGADCLCIVRYDNNGPNMQFVSGSHVCNPELGSIYYEQAENLKHTIEDGIEFDERGSHVAYFVKTKPKSKDILENYERIPAKGKKTGKTLAWLISNKKVSPDHNRAVPELAQSLEKINKLDRYFESTISKAEQASKILQTIEHQIESTGENPYDSLIKKRQGMGTTTEQLIDADALQVLGDGLANRIAETTSNQTFNLTQGASMKVFTTDIGSDFIAVSSTGFNQICSSLDIPPEVAMQMYNSNYSASRASINSYGYIVSVKREMFVNQFYIPYYKLWLEFQILTNKIKVPAYIDNINDYMVTDSYSQCRFTGNNMPHIDPLKEVKSVELMLALNLINREQATEILGQGEWSENYSKLTEENKLLPKEELVEEETKNKSNDTKGNTNIR